MAFLGADTDELREAQQKCQEGKEITDQVITFVKALIALLRAASFFTGGASAAYATFLETQVLPWLQKISMALGMFAQVLGANAEAQDQVSAGETVDFSALPTYTSPLQTEQSKAPLSSWNRALHAGRITIRTIGPMRHMNGKDYFDRHDTDADGVSYRQLTVDALVEALGPASS